MSQPLTVAIEGGIGCGKSTFISFFENLPSFETIPEPLERWTNFCGQDFLKLFYTDPKKWTASFQSYVMLTMLQSHTAHVDKPIRLMERSIFSGRHVFMELGRKKGYLNDLDFNVLDQWYNFTVEKFNLKLDMIIYMKCPTSLAMDRMQERGRDGEDALLLSDMEALTTLHESWMEAVKCPVFTVDVSGGLGDVARIARDCEHHILNYFK